MMKLHILSDLHLEFKDYSIPITDYDVLVLAGDIHTKGRGLAWALESTAKPVVYVLGNHEYYGKAYPKHLHDLKRLAEHTNVHVLEDDAVTINGVNFLGCTLWTDFNLFGEPRLAGFECQQVMNDFKKIRLSPKFSKLRSVDAASINMHSVKWLEQALEQRAGQTNVVVTHHGPSICSLPDRRREDITCAAYVSNLEALIRKMNPVLWIHGHIHHSSDYHIGQCKIVCNPRGYHPDELNAGFDSKYIVELNNLKAA